MNKKVFARALLKVFGSKFLGSRPFSQKARDKWLLQQVSKQPFVRGQIVSLDLVVAIGSFIALLLVISLVWASVSLGTTTQRPLEAEAIRISDVLMGPGVPGNWNITNVQQYGLMESYTSRINETKVKAIVNYTNNSSNYGAFKLFLGTPYEIYVLAVLASNQTSVLNVNGTYLEFGRRPFNLTLPTQNSSLAIGNSTNIASVQRDIIYNNTISIMYVVSWR